MESHLKPKIEWTHFDFHRFAKGDKFAETRQLVQKLQEPLIGYGWLVSNN